MMTVADLLAELQQLPDRQAAGILILELQKLPSEFPILTQDAQGDLRGVEIVTL